MEIAIIRKRYTFHGGAEGFARALIERLAGEGHTVHLFAISWDGAGLDHPNVRLHRVPALAFNSFFRDLSFALLASRAACRGGFDIVQSHDKTLGQDIYRAGDGCHLGWLKRRWPRSYALGKLSIALNPYHWLILALERAILKGRRYRRIIAISRLVQKDLMDLYGVPEGDIALIYNGVDLDRFAPGRGDGLRSEVRGRHGIAPGDTVALFVGSGFERKGLGFALRALDLVPEPLTLLVVGRGRPLPFLSATGNKRVVYAGPRPDVHAYYSASDMFVFPAVYEPFGNVHLEAMASGLPVITTAGAGGAEVIEDGIEGFIVPRPEDSQGISRAIRALMDPALRDRMSKAARLRAEGFTFDRNVRETLALYNKVIDEKRHGG